MILGILFLQLSEVVLLQQQTPAGEKAHTAVRDNSYNSTQLLGLLFAFHQGADMRL
jgi:hypothetical protein